MTVVDPRGHQVVKDVSFEVRAGEVLGIAGVQGNGQTELIKALLGLVKPDAGRIQIDGNDISTHGPRASLEHGIGYIPEDRSHDGLRRLLHGPARTSSSTSTAATPFSRGLALKLDDIAENADARIKEFDIRTESPRALHPRRSRGQPAEGRRGPGVLPSAQGC